MFIIRRCWYKFNIFRSESSCYCLFTAESIGLGSGKRGRNEYSLGPTPQLSELSSPPPGGPSLFVFLSPSHSLSLSLSLCLSFSLSLSIPFSHLPAHNHTPLHTCPSLLFTSSFFLCVFLSSSSHTIHNTPLASLSLTLQTTHINTHSLLSFFFCHPPAHPQVHHITVVCISLSYTLQLTHMKNRV